MYSGSTCISNPVRSKVDNSKILSKHGKKKLFVAEGSGFRNNCGGNSSDRRTRIPQAPPSHSAAGSPQLCRSRLGCGFAPAPFALPRHKQKERERERWRDGEMERERDKVGGSEPERQQKTRREERGEIKREGARGAQNEN